MADVGPGGHLLFFATPFGKDVLFFSSSKMLKEHLFGKKIKHQVDVDVVEMTVGQNLRCFGV